MLVQLDDATHREPAEVIRDALSVYWWHAREQSAGMDLLPPPDREEPPTNSPRDSGNSRWPVEPLGFVPLP